MFIFKRFSQLRSTQTHLKRNFNCFILEGYVALYQGIVSFLASAILTFAAAKVHIIYNIHKPFTPPE